MKQASEHMFEAFGMGVGSPELECICGRQHCAPDSDCIEEEEGATMRARHAANPARVVLHEGDDGVSAKTINGSTVVTECECNFFAKLESILWHERDHILDYYRRRRDSDEKRAASISAGLRAALGERDE